MLINWKIIFYLLFIIFILIFGNCNSQDIPLLCYKEYNPATRTLNDSLTECEQTKEQNIYRAFFDPNGNYLSRVEYWKNDELIWFYTYPEAPQYSETYRDLILQFQSTKYGPFLSISHNRILYNLINIQTSSNQKDKPSQYFQLCNFSQDSLCDSYLGQNYLLLKLANLHSNDSYYFDWEKEKYYKDTKDKQLELSIENLLQPLAKIAQYLPQHLMD